MDFKTIVQALSDGRIEFVVIGDFAALVFGAQGVSLVFEICYSLADGNPGRLGEVLSRFHPRLRGSPEDIGFVPDEATLGNESFFRLATDLGAIDLLAEVPGVGGYDEARRGSTVIEAFGRDVAVLDIPALIASKRAAARPKDIATLRELESLLEAESE